MGWDRPCRSYFMFVKFIDGEHDSPIYHSDSDPAMGRVISKGESALDHLRHRLEEMNIVVPPSVFEQVQADCDNNIGNRMVRYDADGLISAEYHPGIQTNSL
jgi:hypothetical protein